MSLQRGAVRALALIPLLLVGLLALVVSPARAQVFLDLSVDPVARVANAGTAPTWNVLLTNNTGGAVTIDLTAFSPGFPLTPDVDISTGTLPSGAIALADGQSLTLSNFITTSIHADATGAVYDALAEMTYNATDADGNDFFDLTAVADWQLTVRAAPASTAAPEPSSIALLLTLPVCCLLRRRWG